MEASMLQARVHWGSATDTDVQRAASVIQKLSSTEKSSRGESPDSQEVPSMTGRVIHMHCSVKSRRLEERACVMRQKTART